MKVYECDSCGALHELGFTGDCRDDAHRLAVAPDDAEIVYLCCDCGEREGEDWADDIDGDDPLCESCRVSRMAHRIDAAADRASER